VAAVDSQYGIGDPEWEVVFDFRGYDAGTNLKTINGWYENGNGTDLFDFSGLPGGFRGSNENGHFYFVGRIGHWWSSTEYYDYTAWYRFLINYYPGVRRYGFDYKFHGASVRCLQDY
jgi:uncharacterized protein (TIGR02145 family)